eukprot:Gb_19168 [translate_table: standard]
MEFWKHPTGVSDPLLPKRIHVKLSKASTIIWSMKACFSRVLLVIAVGIFIAYDYTYFYANTNVNTSPGEYHDRFLKMGCNETIAKHLMKITEEPHVAGTPENFATADYVLSTFQSYGLDAHYTDFHVLLSYPLSRSLSLSLPDGQITHFDLKEKVLDSDPSTKSSKVIPTFHAYSPSGDVSAEVVYANYGREEDYYTLREMGIDVRGAIVLAKYWMIYRGDIIENAAKAGAIGVVVYSDPQDYGGNRTQGYYPDSRWLPPTGVQRGSVYAEIGDPLTPGWPSISDAERLSDDDLKASMPPIPSLPISAEDATAIMMSLQVKQGLWRSFFVKSSKWQKAWKLVKLVSTMGGDAVTTEPVVLVVDEEVRKIIEEAGLLAFFNNFKGNSEGVTRQFIDTWKEGRVIVDKSEFLVSAGLIAKVFDLPNEGEWKLRGKPSLLDMADTSEDEKAVEDPSPAGNKSSLVKGPVADPSGKVESPGGTFVVSEELRKC